MQIKENQWQVGKVKITRILESEGAFGLFVVPDATPENLQGMDWLKPHFVNDKWVAMVSIHALIIDTPSKTIVVDTCLGNDKKRSVPGWSNLHTNFLEDMHHAGYPEDIIDTVLCTHLHTDHVGWNTKLVNGEWVPTFENAEYLFGKDEWEYTEKQSSQDPHYNEFFVDSIKPIQEAGLVRFVGTNEQICDEVILEPTLGHTPGHVSIRIESEGKKAAITGDFLHHPSQMEKLEWESIVDWDASMAKETRRRKLQEYSEEDILVFGTHFASPSAGKVIKKGDHFIFKV